MASLGFAVVCGVCGCDGSEGIADASVGADATVSDGGANDAGPSDAGAGDASAGPIEGFGALLAVGSEEGTVVTGMFAPGWSETAWVAGVSPNCSSIQEAGGCRIYTCAGMPPLVSAGDTEVEHEDEVYAVPSMSGLYLQSLDVVVAPGESITFRAAGDEVPAFEGTVVQPGSIEVTAPAQVPRDEDFEVTWAPGGDRVVLTLATAGGVLVCTADGAQGSVSMPGELLTALPSGGAALSAMRANTVTVEPSSTFRVSLSAAQVHTTDTFNLN